MYRLLTLLAVVTLAIATPTPLQPDIKPKAGLLPYQFAVDVNSTDAAYLCFDFGVNPTCNQGLCANKVTGSSGKIALRDLQLRVVACNADHENSTIARTAYTFDSEVLPVTGNDFAGAISENRLAITGTRTSGSMNYFTRQDGEPWSLQQTRPSVPYAGEIAMSDDITLIGSATVHTVIADDSNVLRSQSSSATFGISVVLSPNNDFALIGDTEANNHGEVYVYNTTTWNVTQTLPLRSCVDPSVLAVFGTVVRTDGLRIVVQSYQAIMIYAKNATSQQWVVEQCILKESCGEYLDIDGNVLFLGDSVYDGGKGALYVYERVNGVWTNTTILRGWQDSGELKPAFPGFIRCRTGHIVALRTDSRRGWPWLYLHVFSQADSFSERVIKHSSAFHASVFAMSSQHILVDNVIYPLELQTANNIVELATPSTVERENPLILRHAIGANVTCKFFHVSASSFAMTDAFALSMYATTTTVLAPAVAGQYELRCRSSGLQDAARQDALSITVNDVCMTLPCLHGATCEHSTSRVPQYVCHCAGGFSGRDCEQHACSVPRCMNGATCNYVPSNATLFTCSCPANFWGTLCDNYGAEPGSSSTGAFVPDPHIIVVRLTMHADKQPEFIPFKEAFVTYLVSLCRERFDATECGVDRFDVVHLGQRALSHWSWAVLFATATHELTVDLHIITSAATKVPGVFILQYVSTRVDAWSKSGASMAIGDMTLTLPSNPLLLQCADGTFRLSCPVAPEGSASLTTGAIIGIVVGCAVAVGGGIFLTWLFCIHKRRNAATCTTVTTAAPSGDSKLPVVPQSINIHISDTASSSNCKDSTHVELTTTSTDTVTASGSAASLEGASASVESSKRPSLPGVVHSRDSMT